MKKQPAKMIYPRLGMVFALLGTVAILFLPELWLPLCLTANVFLAAGAVCGTEVKTVTRSNPMAKFSEDAPETIQGQVFRVPFLPILLGSAVAVAVGIIQGSVIAGVLTFFTWGGLSYPLALCVLSRGDLNASLQVGLASASVVTLLGTALQIWLTSPGWTFQPRYCYELISKAIVPDLEKVLSVALESGIITETGFQAAFGKVSVGAAAQTMLNSALVTLPAVIAVILLLTLCVLWFGIKAALKRDASVEIKHMGRLDGYQPARALSPIYLISVLLSLFSQGNSVIQISATNAMYVLSAVLMFAGFSLILYIINTRAPSAVARVFLVIGTVITACSSCGSSLLVLLGLMSIGRDMRGGFGGGTLY